MDDASNVGHNSMTPFDEASHAVETLRVEAENWLDGEPIENRGQADAVAKLIDDARSAFNVAEKARKTEKQPHIDAGKAVDERFKPLKDQAETIGKGAKALLTPWLEKLETAKRAKEAQARAEAEAKQKAADEAAAEAAKNATDLAAADEAAAEAAEAKKAQYASKAATSDKAAAKGGKRAVSLRTVREAEVVNASQFLGWLWNNDREACEVFAAEMAGKKLRSGIADMDGVTITERKVAV